MHFGYNCNKYLPKIKKCRLLINRYLKKSEYLKIRWMGDAEVLCYLDCTVDNIIQKIQEGKIKIKIAKNGKISYGIKVPCDYDDCYLANSGGKCLFYEQHRGNQISCIEDVKKHQLWHPNDKTISDNELYHLHQQVLKYRNKRL